MQTSLVENIAKDIKDTLTLLDDTTYSVQNMGDSPIFGATDHADSEAPAENEYSFRVEPGAFILIKPSTDNGVWFKSHDDNIVGVEDGV